MEFVTIDDIRSAARRVGHAAVRTPLLAQVWGSDTSPLWLKPENLQPMGAFKIRGAYNAVAALDLARRERGVVTHSSGNHAQAVALAANLFSVPAAIVVPDTTPRIKVKATEQYGATVVEVATAQRESAAREIAERRDMALIPPFDDPHVIAGQGTIGLEIAEQLPDVAVVLVPISGGGLASGIGTAIKARCPNATIYGVEPELAGDTAESLRAGRMIDWPAEHRERTIADGLRAQPSELTFAHMLATLDDIITVPESDIRAAVRTLATQARLVAEPSGAVATAAYLFHAETLPAGPTVAVVSGGNLPAQQLAEIVGS